MDFRPDREIGNEVLKVENLTKYQDGKILLDKRKLTTIDEERVIFETNRIYERVKA